MMADIPVPAPWGEQRASHADREAVVARLQQAAADGRVDFAELDARLELALSAKTRAELARLTADLWLPGEPDPDRPLILKGGVHGAVRKGRWQVPSRVTAYGGLGGVILDFTQVDREGIYEVEVEAHGQMGGVVIIVPDGWAAQTDDVDPALGGVKNGTTPDPLPGTPLIRLTGNGGMGGVVVRHPKRRERRKLKRAALTAA
ncbi:DUF1707 domain-containing protein [Streptomyces morookaense]|uniref:DUF1707 SHOCT-like domain-containing protein n=1 Tax=Streptomyces TaxID=1883 RepID=UPI001D101DD8|nr:DUF1707 domain-containing protein [Streptomyces sp. ET3-23]MCC2278330.1 DUF1707 domain-containing protein [Streptomyces sp. ET3-23]